MSNWFKKQITNIAIAMANVEKNVFSQEGLDLASNTSMTQTKNQHSVIEFLECLEKSMINLKTKHN
jgi:hypothetical protein